MIVIGTPHGGAVSPEWLVGWERLQMPEKANGAPDYVVARTYRKAVAAARNEIVQTTLMRFPNATHLFFLDDDVIVPPDGLLRLLSVSQEHNLPIVTGLCTQRVAPYLPCVYRQAANGEYVHLARFCEGLQELDACGAACLLVRLDVLRALSAPHFEWTNGFSEDIDFCRKAKAAGFPIVLDFRVCCIHLGTLEARYDLFERELAEGGVTFGNEEVARLAQDVRPWIVTR